MIGTTKSMDFAEAIDTKFAGQGFEYAVIAGRKYDKIVRIRYGANHPESVYAFIDRSTGDLLKAESYRKPAKGVRYTADELMTTAVEDADRYGSFLYHR